ncbi:hypothetical protein JZ751_028911 [Albula glossodonta]|uniref:Uncharacterized protein n=1 Tax=Albula glossodonta TaxID=121402 RepID=A0A8T2NA75_9TELE|nr:hypothetical protein JZ751_028911 [Albula glossodonta]
MNSNSGTNLTKSSQIREERSNIPDALPIVAATSPMRRALRRCLCVTTPWSGRRRRNLITTIITTIAATDAESARGSSARLTGLMATSPPAPRVLAQRRDGGRGREGEERGMEQKRLEERQKEREKDERRENSDRERGKENSNAHREWGYGVTAELGREGVGPQLGAVAQIKGDDEPLTY